MSARLNRSSDSCSYWLQDASRRHWLRAGAALFGLLLSALPAAAAGQARPADKARAGQATSENDKAAAELLFERGLAAMKQGRFAEACADLEQSQDLDRGIGTMLYLAECYEYQGRTASAWALFREASSAARAAGQNERAKIGSARAIRLESRLSKVRVHVPTNSALPGLLVLRDGQPLPRGAWDVALPADPGPIRIEARAPDRVIWQATRELSDTGVVLTVDIPLLEALPVRPRPAQLQLVRGSSDDNSAAQPPTAADAAALSPTAGSSWQAPVGIAIGGAGLIGLGVGTYFGLRAISKNHELERACPASDCGSSARGRSLDDDAHSAARLANVLVIGGAVLFVSGALIFFSAPSGESAELRVHATAGGGAIQLRGQL